MNKFTKKKSGFTPVAAVCLVLATVAIGLGIYFGFCGDRGITPEQIRDAKLTELSEHKGEYCEETIVLSDTTRGMAELLAEKTGAKLRITKDGSYATLTLTDGRTIEDVFSDEALLEYIPDFSLDYYTSISETDEPDESAHEHLPSRPTTIFSDEFYGNQSYLDYMNLGNLLDSYNGAGITVAVIDTGIDTDHPEFAGRISEWSYNATEEKIVKDYGYDWSLIEDEQGHGTAVAGVIGAGVNNGGVAGIANGVELLVIKAECDSNGGFFRTSDLMFGLYYAIERDVDVINMSFGGQDNTFSAAAKLAIDSDIICIAAAGNDATALPKYPAADANVIGVGALSGDSWELAKYSNYGDNSDIVAPGTVYTACMGGGYQTISGTSFASPIVAATVALLKQQNRYITFDKVRELLYASSYDLGDPGEDWYYGYGALDASALLTEERGTVTFNYLTDEIDGTEQVFIRNHTLQSLPEPERNYSVFDGWYYDIYCTEEVEWYADIWTQDLTLYAGWCNEDDGVPYTYVTLDDGTVEIRSYTGKRRYITVPDRIDGKTVSSIGDFAFSGETRLRTVRLPSQLKNIGMEAFADCANIVSIEIPESVEVIGNGAFSGAVRLADIIFTGDSQLKTVGSNAFANTSLTHFEVPAKVTVLDGSAFLGTTRMKSYTVNNGNTAFTADGGVLFNLTKSTVVAYPAGVSGTYTVPDTVTTVGDCAFAYTRSTSVGLNKAVTIGSGAFAFAAIEEIVIPDSTTEMKISAFAYCEHLSSVRLGHGLTKIPEECFCFDMSLTSVTIPNKIQTIASRAFYVSGLKTLTFEKDSELLEIEAESFVLTSLEEVTFPKSLISICASAFSENYSLSSVRFEGGSNLQYIGSEAFEQTRALKNIDFPDSLLSIGDYAFILSGLENTVTIPGAVTYIGGGAFASCHSLTAFSVEDGNQVYQSTDGVIFSKDGKTLIEYPAGRENTNYAVPEDVTVIYNASFYGSQKLVDLSFPESLEEICEKSFYDCTAINYLSVPDNVIKIGSYSFGNTVSLGHIDFNDTSKLARIGFAAFAGAGIYDFRVPASVSSIAQYAFEECDKLYTVTFAANSSLENLAAYQFAGADRLQYVTFESGSKLKNIEAHAFENMQSLYSVDLGDAQVTNIDNYAFRYCSGLQNLSIPETVVSIGRYAFYGDENLASLTLSGNIEHIGRYAFYTRNSTMSLYFSEDTLPPILDENWDEGIRGYTCGVSELKTVGDYDVAVLTSGNIAVLKYIGTSSEADLTKTDFGGDVVTVGGYAFYRSSVETVVLPSTVQAIEPYAFAYSGIKSITIPSKVGFIGKYAFYHSALTDLTFAADSTVARIEKYAFADCDRLTTVTIPASVTTLGSCVFSGSGLTSVNFAEGTVLTEIPESAFSSTELMSVVIPDSVSSIGHNAFRDNMLLDSITLGSGVKQIGANVFYHTGLKNVTIPENIDYVGEYSFVGLENLTAFTVDANNAHYKSVDGVLFSKDGRKLISMPANKTGSYTVPASVETIGYGAFENSKLSSVTFGDGINLLTLGYRAFYNADELTSVTIPESVVSIDYYAFAMCDKLASVTFAEENSLTGIYEGTFYLCGSLDNITLPDTIVEISDYAFYGCDKLTGIPISDTSEIKGICDYAFAYTGISGEMMTPDTLIDIGEYAFMGTHVKSIDVRTTDETQFLLRIGLGAFNECNELESITLPFVGAAFEDEEISWFGWIFGAGNGEANASYIPASLKTVKIEEGIGFLGICAFYGVNTIDYIDFPYSVRFLYPDCLSMGVDENEHFPRYELKNYMQTCDKFGNPQTAFDFYEGGITGTLRIAEGVTEISQGAFRKCYYLEHVEFPSTLKQIQSGAFYLCSSLIDIEIPEGQTEIVGFTFVGCDSLSKIVLPSTLVSISDLVFEGPGIDCIVYNHGDFVWDFNKIFLPKAMMVVEKDGSIRYRDGDTVEHIQTPDGFEFTWDNDTYRLVAYHGDEKTVALPETFNGQPYQPYCLFGIENVIIPDGWTEICSFAFHSSTTMKTVRIPDSVKIIGEGSFYGCANLQSVQLPENLEEIDDFAFAFCEKIKEIHIPESVTGIGEGVFSNCTSLASASVPDGVVEIKYGTFEDCSSLTKVHLGEGVISLGNEAFYNCTSLKEIEIPSSVKTISSTSFNNSGLQTVNLNDNTYFTVRDEIIYNSDMTQIIFVPDTIGTVCIPKEVTEIGEVFRETNLSEITFESGSELHVIPNSAFCNCVNLKKIIFPENLELIGADSFYNCISLKEIAIPDSVSEMYVGAFEKCTPEIFIIGKNVNSEYEWFRGLLPMTIVLSSENPNYVLENGLLMNKDKTEIVLAENKLKRVEIPASVTDLNNAFSYHTNLSVVTFEEGTQLKKIEHYAFEHTGICSTDIPEGVTEIGIAAFQGCEKLSVLTLPSSLKKIDACAFECGNIKYVKNNSDIELIMSDDYWESYNSTGCLTYRINGVIEDKNGNRQYRDRRYNDNSVFEEIYKETSIVETSDGFIFLKEGDDKYTLHAYAGDEENVTLPISVNGHPYSIDRMIGVDNLIIPDGFSEISNFAFENYFYRDDGTKRSSTLKSVIISDSVKYIVPGAFMNCDGLTGITALGKWENVYYSSFYDSGYYLDKANWDNGLLDINGWLCGADPEIRILDLSCYDGIASEMTKEILNHVETAIVDSPRETGEVLDLSNLKTLVLKAVPEGLPYPPLTLKTVVLDVDDYQLPPDLFCRFNGVRILVNRYKEDVMWDEDTPTWSNGNKVYYKGEWIHAEFCDADGNVISSDYYTPSQVIRQPYIAPIVDGDTTTAFVGWDTDGDGVPNPFPATSATDISAKAVMATAETTYTVRFLDKDGKVIETHTLRHGLPIVAPTATEIEGYVFVGWENYYEGMTACADVDIQGVWKMIGRITLSGKVSSYNPNNAVTIELKQGNKVRYTATIAATTGSGQVAQSFTLTDVSAGTYDLVVTKAGHLAYTVTGVTVGEDDLDLTKSDKSYANMVMIAGDIDGDGKVNSSDWSILWGDANYLKSAASAQNKLADLDGDGNVNSSDWSILWSDANYLKSAEHTTVGY